MNKAELVTNVSQKVNSTKKQADEFVTAVLDTIQETLGKGENIKIVGAFSLECRDCKPKKCRNPKTGEEVFVPASKKVVFKASKQWKDAVKGS
jgi:DNA-binding protein HU-beta